VNQGGEFAYLNSVDLASGEAKFHEKADWDVQGTDFWRPQLAANPGIDTCFVGAGTPILV
jgi:hypothetical protein